MTRGKARARGGAAGHAFRENQKRKREETQHSANNSFPGTFQDQPAKKVKNTIPHHPSSRQDPAPLSTTQNEAAAEPTSQRESARTTAGVADLPTDLSSTHQVTTMSIISSSHIQKKVTRILDTLSTFSFSDPKPHVILLQAKAPVACKLITIAEIAKRELAKNGAKWFQYNVALKADITGALNSANEDENTTEVDVDADEDEDEETADFEKMKTPFERAIEGRPKIRSVATLALYLSRVRIDSLKKTYGLVGLDCFCRIWSLLTRT
ncbi:hypothetical protein CJF30_00007335 [Rutstroemia sp. NJR-2017a BBW]|nr:hypothetical protein CJF30_00007335 [Rutstroemia sp. NJR-2017a BBW]